MSHAMTSLCPWYGDPLPTGTLVTYEDGETAPIPVLNFAERHTWQLNLGAYSHAEAADYLDELAKVCAQLSHECRTYVAHMEGTL